MEFDATFDAEGKISVPPAVPGGMDVRSGLRVRVHLTAHGVSDVLRTRGVTEEEIDAIADRQLEDRDRVIAFLLSEGAWKGRRKGKPD